MVRGHVDKDLEESKTRSMVRIRDEKQDFREQLKRKPFRCCNNKPAFNAHCLQHFLLSGGFLFSDV
ncbi:hypothetical protein E2C01_092115 [Portunus trituberculatus]|uniref:Uncharacterized protein n=1 Tax=Portunus trituberculatus TaxID=210409 RepID=A0A5B7JR71_PORTR|nr:hypothetical protein [Portunus trituberculatus]